MGRAGQKFGAPMKSLLVALFSLSLGLPADAQTTSADRNAAAATINRWYACVGTSYGSQRVTQIDRNAAMEIAFAACATEEDTVRLAAQLLQLFPWQIEQVIVAHKVRMKQEYTKR